MNYNSYQVKQKILWRLILFANGTNA